jgi:hypothetical protein
MRYLTWALIPALACAAPALAKKEVAPTGLALQQIQTKNFEAPKEVAFSAVMSVLQDAGYRIGSADKDTGLITGTASTKSKMTYSLWTGFGKSKKSPVVSAFIEPMGAGSRVRLNFVMAKVKSTLYGSQPQDEEPIYDPATYQDAFEKINQAIFIRLGVDGPATAPAAAPVAAPVAAAAPSAVVPVSAASVASPK